MQRHGSHFSRVMEDPGCAWPEDEPVFDDFIQGMRRCQVFKECFFPPFDGPFEDIEPFEEGFLSFEYADMVEGAEQSASMGRIRFKDCSKSTRSDQASP